ncbi:MAG: cell division protein FtsZ [Saprospiraceae bacterium]
MKVKNNNSDSIIKVIGVGGGGGNAVSHMYNKGITGVSFAVCNTDQQAMENCIVPLKIALGPNLTEGRGAGSQPEIGKQACIESEAELKAYFGEKTKMIFITAGMGGGTGTGAAPEVARIAKEMGILTVSIVTLPFKFEGAKRMRLALEGLEEMKKNVDSILTISNQKIKEYYGNMAIGAAFSQADNVLTTAARGIAEIITVPGIINVDFADVNAVMRESGVAIMGNSIAEGDNRARKAIQEAMSSPLLEENDIRGAKNILLNITSGQDELTMDELAEITDYVQEEAGYGTDMIFGTCRDMSLGKNISVTIIATGFNENTLVKEKNSHETIFVPLDEETALSPENGIVMGLAEGDEVHTIDFEDDDIKSTIDQYKVSNVSSWNESKIEPTHNRKKTELDKEKFEEMERARRDYMRQGVMKNLDDPRSISNMENEPAYKRRNVVLDNVRDITADRTSKFEVTIDEDNPLRESGNSFLHDNVD